MEFLKVNVLDKYQNGEKNAAIEWKNCLEKYETYLKENEKNFDKNLFKLYSETDWFHDFELLKICYLALTEHIKNKRDTIKLLFKFDNVYYRITLENIVSAKIDINNFVEENHGIDDIVLSEILIKKGYHTLNILTASDSEFSIEFKNFKVEKFILK